MVIIWDRNLSERDPMRSCFLALGLAAFCPVVATAELEFSLYGGAQSAPHSDLQFRGDSVIPDQDLFIAWEGRSFDAPPYYGLRVTNWRSETLGYGLDFTHAKVYPAPGELPAGFDRLEMTDGINTLTANVYRRWPGQFGAVTPYVGAGLGLSIPYVEVDYGPSSTEGYQITGAAASLIAGGSYAVTDRWSVFGEYKFSYTQNTADLDGGGTLKGDVILNALNVGVSFSF